jgi:Ca-activated chloride channel family protein
MVIVTDGYIQAERDVFELIQDNMNRTNVFAFGIGSGVNRYLIEGMAKAGMGEPFVVTDKDEAPKTARTFREYISAPVLTGASVRFDGFETYDVEPPSIPDLFAKRPVIVFGKWRGKARGKVTLTGTGGQGIYRQVFDVSKIKPADVNRAQRYLWARSRIARLSDFQKGKSDPDRKAEITSLGLTYNLLTAYTSFIAVLEEVRNPQGTAKNVKQPLPLPKGVSNNAVGGCATVPEPDLLYLLAGLGVIAILMNRKRISNRG